VYRVLKKNGRFITHQPNLEGMFGAAMLYHDFTHELGFCRQNISQVFLSSGFSKVETYEDTPVIHGFKSFIRYILWKYFVKNLYKFLWLVECGGVEKDIIFTQNFLSVIIK
jgi:hypothetical protein